MGVYSWPAVKDYWRHDGLNPNHMICKEMDQIQFHQVQQCYHISSPDFTMIAPTERSLWCSKVNVSVEELLNGSQQFRMHSTPFAQK